MKTATAQPITSTPNPLSSASKEQPELGMTPCLAGSKLDVKSDDTTHHVASSEASTEAYENSLECLKASTESLAARIQQVEKSTDHKIKGAYKFTAETRNRIDVVKGEQDIMRDKAFQQGLQIDSLTESNEQLREEVLKQQVKIDELESEISRLEHELRTTADHWDKKFQKMAGDIEQLKKDKADMMFELESLKAQMATMADREPNPTNEIDSFPLGQQTSAADRARDAKMVHIEKRLNDTDMKLTQQQIKLAEVELEMDVGKATTKNGKTLWRIPNIQQRFRDAKNGRVTSLYSPPFYSSDDGYKMCLKVYPNGDGMGKGMYMSVYFNIMKGEYDGLQKWPFEHKVQLTLVDQDQRRHHTETFRGDPDSSSFQRPIHGMNKATGIPRFLPTDVVFGRDSSYIKNDEMFIECQVDTSTMKPAVR